jgi:hypothetical protein
MSVFHILKQDVYMKRKTLKQAIDVLCDLSQLSRQDAGLFLVS